MKTIQTISLLVALGATTHSVKATVYTVSNNLNSPGQYTNLQVAHDAAANGDTLYIHASPVNYGSLTVKKKITLIGEGAMSNTQLHYETEVNSISLSYAPAPASTSANGSRIYGLAIGSVVFNASNSAATAVVGGVVLSRNVLGSVSVSVLGGSIFSGGNTFSQNVINSLNGVFVGSVFSNNIIRTMIVNPVGSGNNLISNNIIENGLTAIGAVVSNNIFFSYGALTIGSNQATTWSNNLFYSTPAITAANIIYGSNTGTGNLFQDPLFVTPALATTLVGYTYTSPASAPFANLHLQATSPGKNYGTDGTDIGIYGGSYPWVDGDSTDSRFRYFPMPAQVPHMISMDVLNPTLPTSGTLNVNFNARTQP